MSHHIVCSTTLNIVIKSESALLLVVKSFLLNNRQQTPISFTESANMFCLEGCIVFSSKLIARIVQFYLYCINRRQRRKYILFYIQKTRYCLLWSIYIYIYIHMCTVYTICNQLYNQHYEGRPFGNDALVY